VFAAINSLEVQIMKLVQSLIVAAVVAIPALSFAQSNQPLTRADIRAQLVELQRVGYNPASDQAQYPKNIEAAQARLNAQQSLASSSYGGLTAGASASGSRDAQSDVIGLGPVYAKP
jgi:hypothetical protein